MISEFPATATPSPADSLLAQESSQELAKLLAGQTLSFQVHPEQESDRNIPIPESALRLLIGLLSQMAQGNSVAVVPVHTDLTTAQAAELLRVSRSYLVDLLDKQAIPSHLVGNHRRVTLQDLLAYKKNNDQLRLDALEELSALDQALGLGY